jgi:hypothetical protein
VSIVELLCSDREAEEISQYLIGLGDLRWVEDLLVHRLDGTVIRIRHGQDPVEESSIYRAIPEVEATGFEVLSVAPLPFAVQRDESAKLVAPEIKKAWDIEVTPVDSTLLLCPTVVADRNDGGWAESIADVLHLATNNETTWDRRLILSPEDQSRPTLSPIPVESSSISAHAAAAAAVLSGAIDPAVRASNIVVPNHEKYRVIRNFARTADMEGAVRQLVSSVLDQEHAVFDGEAHARRAEDPGKLVRLASDSMADSYKLRYSPKRPAEPRFQVGLLAAVKMLIEFVATGLQRLPKTMLNRVRAQMISSLEKSVSLLVLGEDGDRSTLELKFGGPSSPMPVSPDDLEANLNSLRSELAAAVDPETVAKWLPTHDGIPEPKLFEELVSRSFGLLDGGGSDDPIVADTAFVSAPPLDPELAAGVVGAVDLIPPEKRSFFARLVDPPSGVPVRLITSDPWRMDALLALIDPEEAAPLLISLPADEGEGEPEAAESDATSGEENADGEDEGDGDDEDPSSENGNSTNAGVEVEIDLVAAIRDGLVEARSNSARAFSTRVGSDILQSLNRARRSFLERMMQLGQSEDVWTDEPERRVKKRLKRLLALFALVVVLSVTFQLLGLLSALLVGVVCGVSFVGSLLGFAWAAVRYQRDAFRREHAFRTGNGLIDGIREDWEAMQRYSDLYRQFADWSAIVAADVHQPVGRLGELVVFGAQQTKPYWLATARSLEVRPGEEQRIRRSVFQRGWRGDAFRAAHRHILEQFAEDHQFSDVPNPFHDAADGYGARGRALGAFARSTEASEIKRRQLEAQVRENFVQPGGGLANPEEVTAVEGRFGKFDSLDDFFDLQGGGGLSGFLLSASGPLRPSGHGGIREVVQSEMSCPRGLGPSTGTGAETIPSGRQWPLLSAVRLDVSADMDLVAPVDQDYVAEPTDSPGPGEPEPWSKSSGPEVRF